MSNPTPRFRTLAVIAAIGVAAIGIGAAVVAASGDDPDDAPVPVEPDGGIGDTPVPVEPDGGIGDTPVPVESARDDAHGLLGRWEDDLPTDVRIARRGSEWRALTEDDLLGRMTVELDAEDGRYRVTSVTLELPDGPETYELVPN